MTTLRGSGSASLLAHSTDEKTVARRGQVTCPELVSDGAKSQMQHLQLWRSHPRSLYCFSIKWLGWDVPGNMLITSHPSSHLIFTKAVLPPRSWESWQNDRLHGMANQNCGFWSQPHRWGNRGSRGLNALCKVAQLPTFPSKAITSGRSAPVGRGRRERARSAQT